jgi:surface antigen
MKLVDVLIRSNTKNARVGRLKFAFLLTLMLGPLTIASSNMAQAQMINPFGKYNGPTLGKEDYKLAGQSMEALLNKTPPTVGGYDTWRNAASGNHGKFTILEIFTSKGMPCRKVNASISYRRGSGVPRSFTLNFCKLPSGEWKTIA